MLACIDVAYRSKLVASKKKETRACSFIKCRLNERGPDWTKWRIKGKMLNGHSFTSRAFPLTNYENFNLLPLGVFLTRHFQPFLHSIRLTIKKFSGNLWFITSTDGVSFNKTGLISFFDVLLCLQRFLI